MTDNLDQADETIDIFDQVIRERDELRTENERITNMRTNDLDQEIIDRLHAEIERRQKALDDCVARLADERVENEGLRAALQEILDHPAPSRVATVAREALANDKE